MVGSPEDTLRLLRRLRQVREYTSQPIPDDVLHDILEVGRWTGTGGNRQPTEVIVIRDREVTKMFAEWGARPAAAGTIDLLLVSNSNDNALDEGRMAERLMLAAAAHGLGAGLATLKNQGPDEAKKLLGIPADKRVIAVVSLGYTDIEARKALPKSAGPLRKPLAQYAHPDRW
jgi:nitroreductase